MEENNLKKLILILGGISILTMAIGGSEIDVLQSMEAWMKASQDAFDTNHPIEALKHLIAIQALHEQTPDEQDPGRKKQRAEFVRRADQKITEFAARFSLEVGDEWLSESGTVKAGSVRELSKGIGLMPSVRLLINYDFGKAVVADAPIRFFFVDGIGDITMVSTTDANGMASTVIRSISRSDKPLLIRAMLVISHKGKTVSFPNVSRDFAYVLPPQTVRIVAAELPGYAISPPSRPLVLASPLTDSISRALASSGLDILVSDGELEASAFLAAFQGDLGAVKKTLFAGK